eukprot:gene8681-11732_t
MTLFSSICIILFISTIAGALSIPIESEVLKYDGSTTFDYNQAQRALWLSVAAYCGKDAYKSHVFKGPTSGFIVTHVMYDPTPDTEGYIGYLPSDKTIYVVYRGSSSIRNWVDNIDVVKTSYTSYSECNCNVHKGWYAAEQNIIQSVVSEVKRLQASLTGYKVMCTGHSLGAAMAQLTAMDLLKAGISNSIYNFGQPRVGDANYANFVNSKLSLWRVTHNKDMVPHVPYTTVESYYHSCREEFENASGGLKTCDSTCEDKTCADQYAFSQTNVDDHLVYLGLNVSCSAVSN